jgi:hypothetical protein
MIKYIKKVNGGGYHHKLDTTLPIHDEIAIYIIEENDHYYFAMQNKRKEEIYIPLEELTKFLDEYDDKMFKEKEEYFDEKVCSTCKHNPPSSDKCPCKGCNINCYNKWESKYSK